MRILSTTALYPPLIVGGAERSAASLAEGLVARGHEVDVLTLSPTAPAQTIHSFENGKWPYPHEVINGVRVHKLPLLNSYWPYQTEGATPKPESKLKRLAWHVRDSANTEMATMVARYASQIQPDIAISHNLQGFSTAIWPSLKKLGLPVLHTLHDFALLCPQTVLYRNGRNCGHQNARCIDCRLLTHPRMQHAQSLDAVVAVSNATLKIHQAHGLFTSIPTQAIHNSVRLGVEPAPRARQQDDARLCFGFLGRVDEVKGFDTLIDAFTQLPQDKVRLVVAGRAQEDFLRSLQNRYDLHNVEFLGFVDPNIVFGLMDVLVFPSHALEALGNGVYEAYFRGLPVIGADNGGIPEMIDTDQTGYVFPVGDSQALREHMLRFVNDATLAPSMQAACLEKALYFKPERRLKQYETFLADTIARHKV